MGAEGPRFHGPEGDGEAVRDLGVGESSVVLQADELTVLIRQRVDGPADLPQLLDLLGTVAGWTVPTR
jgi:hypothetical protein